VISLSVESNRAGASFGSRIQREREREHLTIGGAPCLCWFIDEDLRMAATVGVAVETGGGGGSGAVKSAGGFPSLTAPSSRSARVRSGWRLGSEPRFFVPLAPTSSL
jgi:hypothetical protein